MNDTIDLPAIEARARALQPAYADPDVPALAEVLREAVEVLRSVEWAIDDGEDVCPSCRIIRFQGFTYEEEGHDPGCRIAALLARVKT